MFALYQSNVVIVKYLNYTNSSVIGIQHSFRNIVLMSDISITILFYTLLRLGFHPEGTKYMNAYYAKYHC